MKFLTSNPNLSLILPGGCNAACSFCFWEENKAVDPAMFLIHLERTLNTLPPEFTQISITGGEPTLSPVFDAVLRVLLDHKQRPGSQWKKVVLTTNGVAMSSDKIESLFWGVVDHVNLSRHAIDDAGNRVVFNSMSVPDAQGIRDRAFTLSKSGIDMNLNVVLSTLEVDYPMNEWVEFAREVGASSIAFRVDHQLGLDVIHEQDRLLAADGFSFLESGCPVCRTREYRYFGIPVMFKYGMSEPSLIQPYELILQSDGSLTLDWAGNHIFIGDQRPLTPAPKRPRIAKVKEPASSCGGSNPKPVYATCGLGFCGVMTPASCGYSSCGTSSSSKGHCGRGGC